MKVVAHRKVSGTNRILGFACLLAIARKCPVHKVLAHETPVTVFEQIESL